MRLFPRLRPAVVAMVVGLTMGVAAPAEAHTNVCIGTGTFVTAAKMYYVGFGGVTATSFTMLFPTRGQCTTVPMPETFSGEIVGNCGVATGIGTSGTGHAFTVLWHGGSLTFDGQVQGELAIKEDPAFGESCVTGARHFVVGGGLLLSH